MFNSSPSTSSILSLKWYIILWIGNSKLEEFELLPQVILSVYFIKNMFLLLEQKEIES